MANEGSKDPFLLDSVDCNTVSVVLSIEYSKEVVSFALDCVGQDREKAALVCKDSGLLVLVLAVVDVVFTFADSQTAVVLVLGCMSFGAVLANNKSQVEVVPFTLDCKVAGIVLAKDGKDVEALGVGCIVVGIRLPT